jgi:hypothetical protein
MVTIKERKETALRPGSTLDTPEAEIVPRSFEISQIPKQLLNPQGSALADGGQLGWLEMSES